MTVVPTDWINFDDSNYTAIVASKPSYDDVSVQVDANQVVAFLSR